MLEFLIGILLLMIMMTFAMIFLVTLTFAMKVVLEIAIHILQAIFEKFDDRK